MTYDENNNPLKFKESFEERLKNHKNVDPWSKESIKEREEFYELYGRGWFWFTDTPVTNKYKNQWIFQYQKIEEESNE